MDKNKELDEALLLLSRLQSNDVCCKPKELQRRIGRFVEENNINNELANKLRAFVAGLFGDFFTQLSKELRPLSNHHLEHNSHKGGRSDALRLNGHGTG